MIVGSNILAGASGQAGYFLNRSVRLRSSASAYFNRTPASASNRTTWTWSAWVKRGTSATNKLFAANAAANDTGYTTIYFFQDALRITGFNTSWRQTTQVFRDYSAWYHIVVVWDTTNATALDRVRIYVNGVQVTAFSITNNPAQNSTGGINAATATYIGAEVYGGPIEFFDGYLTEINFIDGQALTPTSFGEYNTITGVWQPKKYGGTYGTNGFYLNFNDNSAATAAAIGKDSSGNGNNWTPNNISVTAGVTYDSMTDVPTLTSATTANYATLNPINSYSASLFQGNLNFADGAGAVYQAYSTIVNPDIANNKFYCEVTVAPSYGVCIAVDTKSGSNSNTSRTGVLSYYSNGQKYNDTTATAYGATFTTGDIIGIAMGNGQLEFFKNGVSQGVAFSSLTGAYKFGVWAAGAAGTGCSFNFGQRPFTYTPPTGFVALNTYNLPTPTIANGAEQFAATTYTGTGSAMTVTNTVNSISLQPDFLWIKQRNSAANHVLADSIRGVNKYIFSNLTNAEATATAGTGITAFNSNGFSLGTETSTVGSVNAAGGTGTYVAWQWKASNATGVTNTAGSITSTVSANPSAGFSIVTWTGTGAAATIGHGLGVAPSMVIWKYRSAVSNWAVGHNRLNNGSSAWSYWVQLETTAAQAASSGPFNNTAPTSTVFSVGSFNNANNMVAYCFSEIAGYSKFGSYTGNGSADGTFVYLGFRPRFILAKRTSAVSDWWLYDTSRNTYNVISTPLFADLSNAEGNNAVYNLDLLSNGFKWRTADTTMNGSGSTYIYMAFAESPFNYSLAR